MFWCTLVFTPDYYILKEKWCIEKEKTPRLYISKVSNKNTKGIVQSENIWRCFCVPIDNFKQVSQITVMCLLPTLNIFCMQNVPFYSA